MYSELQKKPFGKHGLENPPFSLIFPLKPSFAGMFQLTTFDFPIFGTIFSLRPWPVGKLWWGFEIQGQSSQT